MGRRNVLVAMVMLCAFGHAYGEETPTRTKEISIYEDVTRFAMAEGIAAAYFGLTSRFPEEFGKFTLVASPLMGGLAAAESRHPWTTFAGGTALFAAYGSWLMANDDRPRTTLWRKQMVAFNVLLLTGWVLDKFIDGDVKESGEHPPAALRFIPLEGGGTLAYERRF